MKLLRSSPPLSNCRACAGILLAGLAALILGGCTLRDSVNFIFGPNHVMEGIEPEFSYNVLPPPWWWPDEDTFDTKENPSALQRKAYHEKYGPPDFLRIWYNNEGAVLSRNTVWSRQGLPEPKGISWIYVERQVEVTFTPSESVERPMNDEVATLCELGDPDEIKFIGNDPSIRAVRYVYWREGLIIDFENFKKVDFKRARELPGWMRS